MGGDVQEFDQAISYGPDQCTWWDECTKYDDYAFFDAELGVIDWKHDYIDGMNLPYGMSWTEWQNDPWYKHGGMSDMFRGSISSLRAKAVGV